MADPILIALPPLEREYFQAMDAAISKATNMREDHLRTVADLESFLAANRPEYDAEIVKFITAKGHDPATVVAVFNPKNQKIEVRPK